MGLLDRLFGGKKKEEEAAFDEAAERAECPHTSLVPRWDEAEDMGKEDKISSYTCEGCGATFSVEEGNRLREQEDKRLKALEGGDR